MSRHALRRRPARGFSLLELVIAISIVAILAGIAIPSYTAYVLHAHRSEALRTLNLLRGALERCYSQNYSYNAGAALCPAAPGTTFTTPNGYYTITYSNMSATTYTLTA